MRTVLKKFWSDEDGAVTVDWVVLTAGIVGLGVGVILVFQDGTTDLADKVSSAVSEVSVNE